MHAIEWLLTSGILLVFDGLLNSQNVHNLCHLLLSASKDEPDMWLDTAPVLTACIS
jgi:hypothetical protein